MFLLCSVSLALSVQYRANAQCPAKPPAVPSKIDTFCTDNNVTSLYALTSSIIKQEGIVNPGYQIQWSTDAEATWKSSNVQLLPDSALAAYNGQKRQIYVRQVNPGQTPCVPTSFVVVYLKSPPKITGLKPLPAPNPDTNRTLFVCEGYNLNLANFIDTTAGYTLKFKASSGDSLVTFNGIYPTAKYTGRDTLFYVANYSPKSCQGAYYAINVSVLPKPTSKNSPSSYQVCEKQPITFTPLDVHVGNNPVYDWYLNKKLVKKGDKTASYTIFPNPFHAGDSVYVNYVVHISADAPYYHCDSVGPPWHSDTISIKILPLAESKFPKGQIKGPDIVYDGQKGAFYQVPLDSTLIYSWRLSNYSQGGTTAAVPAGTMVSSNNTTKIDFLKGLDYSSNNEILDTLFITAKNVCDSTRDSIIIHIRPYLRPINILTPNGDGINDTWIVDNIDYPAYTSNQVMIYNRYGNMVYQANGYKNETAWNGTFNGKPLSEGTYYYVLLYKEDKIQKSLKGYITILRK